MHFLALEIGGTKLQLCVGTADGKIVARQRHDIERSAGGKGIRLQIEASLPALLEEWSPQGIGVGFGGPVRWREGVIARSHHIEGWNDYPLADWLTRRSKLPARVDNDANVAALGEARHGAGKGCGTVFYITLGSGVGGGLVSDGRIYHGATPGEVEIGHVRLERDGAVVEERCAGWAVDKRVQREVELHPDSPLAQIVRKAPPGNEAKHLRGALAQGDRLAEAILDDTMQTLAFALSHVVHLLHPDVIVVGGGLALLGEPLRASLAARLSQHLMGAFLPGPTIALAALAEDAVPVGALVLAAS